VISLFLLVGGVDYQSTRPENRWPPLGQFFGFAFLASLVLFLLLTGVAVLRAGRLVLDGDKALLPRIPAGPWGFLPPHELHY